MVYRGDDEFLTRVAGFVDAGLAAGDKVLVIASKRKLDRLRRAVGPFVERRLELWDATASFSRQPGFLQLAVDYVHEQPNHTRLVAEPQLERCSDLEVKTYLGQESAANAVLADLPVTILCTYDNATIRADVVDACRQHHAGLVHEGHVVDNPAYVEPTDFLRSHRGLSESPDAARGLTCRSVDDLAAARRLVAAESDDAGLGDRPGLDLVVAVNEVLTNALTHARSPARLEVYRQGAAVVCSVRDRGPGFEDPSVGWVSPPDDLSTGRGLLLARQLCDSVEIASDPTGTHVRLVMLPDA